MKKSEVYQNASLKEIFYLNYFQIFPFTVRSDSTSKERFELIELENYVKDAFKKFSISS